MHPPLLILSLVVDLACRSHSGFSAPEIFRPIWRAETMSSLEIAALTGKEHKNVIRDIENMLADLEKDGSDLSHQGKSIRYDKDARGYTAAIHLPKRETLVLVSGYNVQMRARIIDRWLPFSGRGATGLARLPEQGSSRGCPLAVPTMQD